MFEQAEEVRILHVDRMSQGLVVTFSDGTVTLYHAHFLYEVREHDGNKQLVDQEPD